MFYFDGTDELCNSTHMNELAGSQGPSFFAGVYFTGSCSITLLLFLPVDIHGWAKIRYPFHLENAIPFFFFYHFLDILITVFFFSTVQTALIMYGSLVEGNDEYDE